MAALVGMKAICNYMARSESTMLTIIRDLDFPAKKLCGIWESDTELANQWRVSQINGKKPEQVEPLPTKTPAKKPQKNNS
jgi:hypothetical protein